MTGSLRGRLLLWYTAMLAMVIVVFGAIVCYAAWRARIADIDDSLRSRAAALGLGLRPAPEGTFDLTLPGDPASDLAYHTVWTPAGSVIDRSDPELDIPRPDSPGFRTRDGRRELAVHAASALVLVGRPLDDVRADIRELAATMAAVGAAAMLASIAGGLYLITRALAPVRRIDETARAMADGDFEARIGVARTDSELGQLARALNEAFDRLHAALERQRRFTADASHELRTPLATISAEVQWVLGRERSAGEYRGSLDVCRRASARMEAIVGRLLALARTEMLPAERAVPVRLDELTRAVVAELRPLSDARRLDVQVEAAAVACLGERERLAEAVTNVVMNAIQYTAEGGRIRVGVQARADYAEVVVSDTGIGIAPAHLPHVFEPFFRADPARTRAAGGSGLGLALTEATLRRHRGEVSCTSEPGRGTTVRMKIPVAPL